MLAHLFEIHGRFCAGHPLEVIVSTFTLTACILNMETESGQPRDEALPLSSHCRVGRCNSDVSRNGSSRSRLYGAVRRKSYDPGRLFRSRREINIRGEKNNGNPAFSSNEKTRTRRKDETRQKDANLNYA